MRQILVILMGLLLSGPATANPQASYCPQDDETCGLSSETASITVMEHAFFLVDLLVQTEAGQPYTDDVCVIGHSLLQSGVPAKPTIEVRGWGGTPDGTSAAILDYSDPFFFLVPQTSPDTSIVDGTEEVIVGYIAMRGIYDPEEPAPCDPETAYLSVFPPGAGLVQTYDGLSWSCGGVDPSDGLDDEEMESLLNGWEWNFEDPQTVIAIEVLPDYDGDGAPNRYDSCVWEPALLWDSNGDGYGNWCDQDYNNDGEVNLSDYIALAINWGCTCPIECSCDLDADGDGVIGMVEYTRMAINWGPIVNKGLDYCAE